MNIVTVRTHSGIKTRILIGNDDSAILLVAYLHGLDNTRHVVLEDVGEHELPLKDRDDEEQDRSHAYATGFFSTLN